MKALYTAITFFACFAPSYAQTLEDFTTTTGSLTFFYGSWELNGDNFGTESPKATFIQDNGFYTIAGTGTINSNSSAVEFFFSPSLSISGNTFLSVSARLDASNVASSFEITLYDSALKSATAIYSTASFSTNSFNEIIVPLNFASGFNSNSIDSFRISGNIPGGSSNFGISFNNIEAVNAIPEPATYAAFAGMAMLGLSVVRRRRVRSV